MIVQVMRTLHILKLRNNGALIQQTELYYVCLDKIRKLLKSKQSQLLIRKTIKEFNNTRFHYLRHAKAEFIFIINIMSSQDHINVVTKGLGNYRSLIFLNIPHNSLNDLLEKYIAQMMQSDK
ncbi:unnamed protein product [Paramecium octaurelia]|uniref:Uncharacterized protein n=1 Tax=Paramecium octaurelia TaxID=43137 RepID=A0A8S1ULG8_PAROT|nr:unnamed protein product [Paramecium octaurelia]